MRTSTKRILSILLATLFLIGFIVVITSLIKPEFEDVMEKRSEVFSKNQMFKAQGQAVDEIDQLIQQIGDFNKLQGTVSLAVPLEPQVPGVLNQLDAIARTSGATFSSFESEPRAFESSDSPLVKRLGVLGLNLSVSGEYQDMKDFLRFLETNVRVFNVKKYTITGGLAGSCEMNIEADTYYQE